MGSIKKSYSKNSGKSLPTVIFNNCNELELLLGNWLGNSNKPWEFMGILMYKLGILHDEDVVVEIFNYSKEDNSFYCMLNDGRIYTMRFKNLNIKGFNPEIELGICNEKYIYECIPMKNIELDMRIFKKAYSIYQNGICFTRYLSMENVVFNIDNGKYILEFGVSKPSDITLPLFDGMGNYSKYELENEDMLVKYLTSLKFPISIVDVYKDICKISLGDVSEYPRVLLKVSKKSFTTGNRVIDLIHLEKGNLENFGMTINGTNRVVLIDKDGNWSYEMNNDDSLVKISLVENTNKINYNICISNNISLDDVKSLVESNMIDASKDVNDTKVLVRKIFDKNIKR